MARTIREFDPFAYGPEHIQRFSACLDPEAGTPFPGEYLRQHEDNFTNILSRETATRTGFRWSTQEYRDMAMSMCRELFGAQFMGYLLHLDESSNGMNAEDINGLPRDFISTLKSESVELYKVGIWFWG
jgi:hypothetical protein